MDAQPLRRRSSSAFGDQRPEARFPLAVRSPSVLSPRLDRDDRKWTGRFGTVLGNGSNGSPFTEETTVNELFFSVPDISCDHCVRAITGEVSCVDGVESVDVELATKTVRVTGSASEAAVRGAIAEAGYEAA